MSTSEPQFANETTGFNLIPFAAMAGGWLGPLLMFCLYVLGPLRPFAYPQGDFLPAWPAVLLVLACSLALWWMPPAYYRVHAFERSGRLYELLGAHWFRALVPDGDLASRWRRRSQAETRLVRNRTLASAFVARTHLSEKSHLVVMGIGIGSSMHAWQIGWHGWALFLALGNVVVNVYPILLQRYTRTRLVPLVARAAAARKRNPLDNPQ